MPLKRLARLFLRELNMTAPFGVVKTRRKGPETGANQPVSGNDISALTPALIFGKFGVARHSNFPASCRTARPPISGAFLFLGLNSFQNG